jgi:hypothetical protein
VRNLSRQSIAAWAGVLCLGCFVAAGQSSSRAKADLVPRVVAPGIYKLANLRIDKKRRAVTFPARLNLSGGPMEYFLVSAWGKTHESILKTDVEPYLIHVAMLLLDAGGAEDAPYPRHRLGNGPSGTSSPGASYISSPGNEIIPGDEIGVELNWSENGKEVRRRAEELVFNEESKAALPGGTWVYNGSRLVNGSFIAEREGSIISLVTDPDSLVNNIGRGHDNDRIWSPNTNNLPPSNVLVQVTIKLRKAHPKI